MKRFLSILLALVLSLSLCLPGLAVSDSGLAEAVEESAALMLQTVSAPEVGTVGGEWAVLGLARSEYAVEPSYWSDYYARVEACVESCAGVLHKRKYTEYSRLIVALSAIGADPADVAGYNLLTPLGDFDKTIWQGINGPIWALIALDAGSYEMPVNPEAETQATRQMYVDEIISRQLRNGGWNLTDRGGDSEADADITGMALQALAKYQDQEAVQTAVDAALSCLSRMQDADGGYASYGSENSESVVQVIVGLCELGLPLDDPRFVKNGHTLMENLFSYRNEDGSFRHTSAGGGSSQMAFEQGFYGIVAALRAAEGKNSLYRMDDRRISLSPSGGDSAAQGLPGKHADVQPVPVTAPGTSFSDLEGHADRTAIEALASRGIITGMGDGSFAPDSSMNRAQFATIVVRALGLSPRSTDEFSDVAASAWYAPYVGTASTYGIVNGRGEGIFDPLGTITRQEAAAMVARAAALCGMDTELEDYEILNVLAQFGDYVSVSTWARESLAFCYGEDILDQRDLDIQPGRAILRCEIARMLYRLLDSAELL